MSPTRKPVYLSANERLVSVANGRWQRQSKVSAPTSTHCGWRDEGRPSKENAPHLRQTVNTLLDVLKVTP